MSLLLIILSKLLFESSLLVLFNPNDVANLNLLISSFYALSNDSRKESIDVHIPIGFPNMLSYYASLTFFGINVMDCFKFEPALLISPALLFPLFELIPS